MRDRAHRIRPQPARPRRSGAAPDPAVAAVLGLQRGAGNAAVTAAELPALHTLALKDDETVGDAERMFMAGLLDRANAALPT